MANKEIKIVNSLYDLPTFQRRLRHVRSITLKNLQCKSFKGKDFTRLQVYFTLHENSKLKEFYTSEVISGSLNPSWQSFDMRRFEDIIDIQAKHVYLRVWVRDGTGSETPYVLVDWNIHLSGLVFFSDKVQPEQYKYIPNMVMVGMFDKYFVAPESPLAPDRDEWVIDASSTLRSSYNINSLSRIYTVLRAISQMQVSVTRVHNSIEDKLLSSMEKTKKLSAREDLLLKVGHLKSELSWQMNKLQHQKDVHDNCVKTRNEKNHEVKAKFHQLEKMKESLEEKRKSYFQTREKYIKENYQLLIRKKQLITELTTFIYPITETRPHILCICGVHLPNSEHFQGQDDTMCSVALGFTCHLVEMMSQILDFPLRYPMQHNSSRSTITDHIHSKLSDKDKTFPLYAKSKEKFQFNYGVFLLNKNISQLRFYCGLGTRDLRLTLHNIKSMLESRLGIKFDHLDAGGARLDFTDNISLPSTEKETVSSLASGGKNNAPHPEELALERALLENSKDHPRDQVSKNKENIPVPLQEIHATPTENGHDDDEELFQSAADGFFKLKTTKFNTDSGNNSSCGSFSEQPNGLIIYDRNFSLSPSPGSGDNSMFVNLSTMQGAHSKTSLQSGDLSGEDTHHSPDSEPVCDNSIKSNSAKNSDTAQTSPINEEQLNGDLGEETQAYS